MTGLEQTFYIMGIVFMSAMFILMIAMVAAVFVIRAKINKIHDAIEDKLDIAMTLAEKGGELAAVASTKVFDTAKRAFNSSKK